MLITDWIEAAVSGATSDGREITETQLTDAAETYSPETYNARIWPEHIRGYAPGSIFKALGDVMQAKVERIKGGALDGRLRLFLKLAPSTDLIAMVRNGEKVHLSLELQDNFAKTGKAYLVGLGVTDSPASLGTGMMKFSASQNTDSQYSDPHRVDIQLEQENDDMKEAQFKKLLDDAMQPIKQQMGEIQEQYKTVAEKQAEIIELARQPAGNDYDGRRPHTGGNPDKRQYNGY